MPLSRSPHAPSPSLPLLGLLVALSGGLLSCDSGRDPGLQQGGGDSGADGGAGDGGGDGGGGDGGGGDGGGGDGGGGDGGAVEAGCDEQDAGAFSELWAEPTQAGPVLRVRWSTGLEGPAEVFFSDGVAAALAPEEGEGGSAVLVGAGPLASLEWQVVVETDRGRVCSAPQQATAGAADPGIPELTQTQAGETGGAFVIVPVIGASERHLVIIDRAGRVVWSQVMADNAYRALLARGGGAMWVGTPAFSDQDDAVIRRIALDGALTEQRGIQGGHTDLVELPDGTLAMLGWDIRERDGRRMLGDTVEELSPGGVQTRAWTVWDEYEPDLSVDYHSDFYEADPAVEDWTHANGLHYADADGSYYVTLANLSLLARIDRATGALVWSVGATSPTIETPDGLIENPHSVQRLDDGSYLVFNRGKSSCSSVVRFTVDEAAGRASLVSRYESPDCLQVLFLGDARQAEDGNTYISWSSAGRLEELDASGGSVREVDLSLGAVLGFIDPVVDLYER
ncbi:aryl-sulfate sulfotransferase [Myxococcota bacterium]|nr:aryl-sulfate sulfotransferase [Myxococcota bacterium]